MADLCKMLDHAIKDEVATSKFYSKLRRSSSCCRGIRRVISVIGREERAHAKILRAIRKDLCGASRR